MTTPLIRYPLDITGVNQNNLVEDEPHTLNNVDVRAIAPKYGAFYTDSVIVKDKSDNSILTKGVQYLCVELAAAATANYGKEICYLILILDKTVSSNVSVTYQVLGGEYSHSVEALMNIYENLKDDDRPIYWINLLNKPTQFNPQPHLHDLKDVYGFQYVVDALERIKQAILLSNQPALQNIVSYVDEEIAKLKDYVDVEIQNVTIPPATETLEGKARYATNAEHLALISATTIVNPAGLKAVLDDSNLVVATAKKLKDQRSFSISGGATASGKVFDGTQNVTLEVTQLNADTLSTGTVPSGVMNGVYDNVTAGKANNLTTARSFSITGAGTAIAQNFNGGQNITLTLTNLNAGNLTTGTVPTGRLSGTYSINISGSATTAGSANTLVTARTIGISGAVTASGVSFDGSANISLNATSLDATKLSGTVPTANLSGTYSINISGSANSASTANTLSTQRTFSISGGASATGVSFDGSQNVSLIVTSLDATKLSGIVPSANLSGNYSINAATSDKLSSAKTITFNGGATGSYSFDGSNNINCTLTVNSTTHSHTTFPFNSTEVPIGFRGIPSLANPTSTFTESQNGLHVLASTIGGSSVTFPSGLTNGYTVTLINDTGNNFTVIQGSGVSLKMIGTGGTGSRIIAKDGCATILYNSSANIGYISGVNIEGTSGGRVVGETAYFDMTTAPPLWLAYDGTTVAISSYPELYAVIGNKYNNGTEPAGHFRLRNSRGTFQRAWNPSSTGSDPNRQQGTLQYDMLGTHAHTGLSVPGSNSDNGDTGTLIITANSQANGTQNISGATTNTTGGAETRPVNYADLLCVYAGR